VKLYPANGPLTTESRAARIATVAAYSREPLPGSVTAAQEILALFVQVRILAG
jgi:hypothetical protein